MSKAYFVKVIPAQLAIIPTLVKEAYEFEETQHDELRMAFSQRLLSSEVRWRTSIKQELKRITDLYYTYLYADSDTGDCNMSAMACQLDIAVLLLSGAIDKGTQWHAIDTFIFALGQVTGA